MIKLASAIIGYISNVTQSENSGRHGLYFAVLKEPPKSNL